MSYFLDRFVAIQDKYYNNYQSRTHYTTWLRTKRFDNIIELKQMPNTYQEIEYKGHSIIVQGIHNEWCHIFDVNGKPFDRSPDQASDIASRGELQFNTVFLAWAWRIDGVGADKPLGWNSEFAVICGSHTSDKIEKTIKLAKKRIDLEAKIVAVSDQLIAMANERMTYASNMSDFTPYNAVIGDQVFIQGHGRLRKGIIVETTGSRFIVAYVTPSNHDDLKYKTLPLSRLYKKEIV
jgi:hypothetical protein